MRIISLGTTVRIIDTYFTSETSDIRTIGENAEKAISLGRSRKVLLIKTFREYRTRGMMSLWVNLTQVRDTKIPSKTFLVVSVRLSLEEISVCISRPITVTVEGQSRTLRSRKSKFTLRLSWDIRLFFPLDINAPDSCVFQFEPGLTLSNHHFSSPNCHVFWLGLDSAVSFPVFSLQICEWQSMGLPSFYSHINQFL